MNQNRVFINSLPKSGTHLLAKAVELFNYQEYFTHRDYVAGSPRFFNYREVKTSLPKIENLENTGKTVGVGTLIPYEVDIAALQYWLNLIPQGQYILGHIPWAAALSPILAELNYRHVFIIRDPRPVVASLLSFILNAQSMLPEPHFLEADFQQLSFQQRLNFILEGGYAPQADIEINGFMEVYRAMLAWRNEPSCLFIRFEDLVGERGGGNAQKQKVAIKNIAAHLDVPFDENNSAITAEIYNPSSRTFRTGQIDAWKQSMDADSVEKLNDYCQPLCQEAGY